MTVPVGADGVLGLYSAVGDAFAGRREGFGRRRAAIAARFARHRGGDERAAAAAWIAGALAEIGLVAVTLTPGATPRARALAHADVPLHGARIAAGLHGVPREAADLVRWHREHDDGTGVPDGLRWDGIPAGAAGVGIAHAFLAGIEDPADPQGPLEAMFALAADAGRRFSVDVVRAFRAFVTEQPDVDAPDATELPAVDEDAAVAALADLIDARDAQTAGVSERLAARAAALAARLGIDAARAERCARLLALGRVADTTPGEAFDPFSRFAREQRTTSARRAAALAAAVPGFAAEAPVLAASAAWFDQGPADPHAAVLAVLVAADGIDPLDAPRRLAAAAGSQLDPDVTRAYLTSIGAPT